jgi:hypothetical protein
MATEASWQQHWKTNEDFVTRSPELPKNHIQAVSISLRLLSPILIPSPLPTPQQSGDIVCKGSL